MFNFLFLALSSSLLFAITEEKFIKDAAYYHYIPTSETLVWDRSSEPIRQQNKPMVFYCKSDGEIVKKIENLPIPKTPSELSNQIRNLDRTVDTQANPLQPIDRIKIGYHIKLGRTIWYYQGDKCFSSYRYDGPKDIINVTHPALIHPYSILENVKRVDVDGYVISPLLFPYHKETITYNDNGQKTVTATQTHERIQKTRQVLVATGIIFAAWGCIKSLFTK